MDIMIWRTQIYSLCCDEVKERSRLLKQHYIHSNEAVDIPKWTYHHMSYETRDRRDP